MAGDSLQSIPSVDRVLQSPRLTRSLADFDRRAVVRLVRDVLDAARERTRGGSPAPDADTVAGQVAEEIGKRWLASPRPVLNATGVLLDTNLGRAPRSEDALAAVQESAAYSDLEYDDIAGNRGSRQNQVGYLLRRLTGTDSAHVVSNNAAAVMLLLAAAAKGRDVIVSRGQAVEIGGGFRVPTIMRQSGARLVEVGTTNRTRLSDYQDAISDRTGAILHVHSSNFRIIGFTEQPSLAELAHLAHFRGLPLLCDNGSGSMLDTAEFGLAHEPMPLEAVEAGADVVTFSADKLLGGPQAGIALGAGTLIRKMARHPLARAVRPDKLVLAALSATLLAYLRGDAVQTIPVWQMIAQTADQIERRAVMFRERAAQRDIQLRLEPGESTVGGGSLPTETMATTHLVLPRRFTAAALRSHSPAIVARTQHGRVLLDLRTVQPSEEAQLLDCLAQMRVIE
ncbi:MAG: L-seryl-tRNA(Sec) selenium transferase [Chloroflexota bacterium]